MQMWRLCGLKETGGAPEGQGSTDKGTDMFSFNKLSEAINSPGPMKHSKLGGNQKNTGAREKRGKA